MINNLNFSQKLDRLITKVGIASVFLMAMSIPHLAGAATLDRQLELGMSGADVSVLQTFLAQDPTIYPEGFVTGYFGPLTKAAVSNFQSRNEIESVGRVGPITLVALNSRIGGGVNTGANIYAPVISSVQVSKVAIAATTTGNTYTATTNTAAISWYTNEPARGIVYYSTSPLTTYEHPHSVDVSGIAVMNDMAMHTFQSITLSGLQPNTTYYYLIYATDAAGNVSITLPSSF